MDRQRDDIDHFVGSTLGPKAAHYRWRGLVNAYYGMWFCFLAGLLVLIGMGTGDSNLTAFGAVSIFFLMIGLVPLNGFYVHRFYREAARVTGRRVNWLHPVPAKQREYIAWCRRNGLSIGPDVERETERPES